MDGSSSPPDWTAPERPKGTSTPFPGAPARADDVQTLIGGSVNRTKNAGPEMLSMGSAVALSIERPAAAVVAGPADVANGSPEGEWVRARTRLL